MDLPRLRRDQMRIAIDPAKVKVLSMGRRWGKTVLGGVLVGLTLQQHGRVAWVAPTYKNTRPMWRWLQMALADDAKHKRVSIHKSERTIETQRGGFVGLYSGDNIDSIRGEAFHLVVIDEAAKIAEDAWTDAIMPTLADFDGDAVLISTPRGKNWFYTEWIRGQGQDKGHRSWTSPTSDNPMPTIRRAFDKVRSRVPERSFRQEWLAEFVDDGSLFRNVTACATAKPLDGRRGDRTYIAGLDWALSYDFTVLTIIDANTRELVFIDRYNGVDYSMQRQRIKAACDRFGIAGMIAESNAMGKPNNDELRRMGLPVRDFVTTNATKADAIESLAAAFEQGNIRILDDPTLIAELQSYEVERLPSGMVRYSAPEGMHDDTVMSLALAWQGAMSAQRRRATVREY